MHTSRETPGSTPSWRVSYPIPAATWVMLRTISFSTSWVAKILIEVSTTMYGGWICKLSETIFETPSGSRFSHVVTRQGKYPTAAVSSIKASFSFSEDPKTQTYRRNVSKRPILIWGTWTSRTCLTYWTCSSCSGQPGVRMTYPKWTISLTISTRLEANSSASEVIKMEWSQIYCSKLISTIRVRKYSALT